MKKIIITGFISVLAAIIMLSACKQSTPAEPPASTATFTKTITPQYTATATPTATATASTTPTVTETALPAGMIDNFEDGDLKSLIWSNMSADYTQWDNSISNGTEGGFGICPSGGGVYGDYALGVTCTVTTAATGGGYGGRVSIYNNTQIEMNQGMDYSGAAAMHFSASMTASAPAGVTYQMNVVAADLVNYIAAHYDFTVLPGAAMQDFIVPAAGFVPDGAYTAASVLSNCTNISVRIEIISPQAGDVAEILFCLDNVYFE